MRFALLDVLRLYRLHTGLVTAAVPGLLAYYLGGSPLLVIAVVIGALSHHAWGFSLNEIADLEVDRGNPDLSGKPLVSGKISKRAAWILSLGALALSFILFFLSALNEGCCPIVPVAFLLGATIFGTIYDLYGKKFPLSDVFVAGWYGLLILASASTIEGWGPYPLAVWAAASMGFLHILFNNSVEGGLKDVDNDETSGAKTLAVVSGCEVKGGKLTISKPFLTWSILLKITFVAMAAVFVLFISEDADWGKWITVVVPLFGILIFIHALTFLQRKQPFDRTDLINKFAVHEILSFAMSLLVVMPVVGIIPAAVALVAPFAWFILFNRLIFRSSVAPKV